MQGAKQGQVSVAETFLRALKRRGIDYVFANAGTDFAPIIEALVKLEDRADEIPRFVTVPHENLAVAMAHGFYLVKGKPAAVMVHVTVGTGNTICALMNVYRDGVPLLLMAGRTPITQSGHIASRSAPIHWGQENFDQAGMVREYTKWDFELRAGQNVDEVVGRALDVALAEPRGPVYLTLPREVLANPDLGDADAPAVAAPVIAEPQPSPSHVETVAEWIAAADWPLIVTSHVGRDLAAAAALAELAETFAIPVVEAGPTCVNLPASHPMSLGQSGGRLLPKADVIVVVDAEVPWFPRAFSPAPGVKVAHLGIDPLWSRYPIRSFPADVAIPGSPRTALRLLVDALAAQRADSGRIAARRAQMAAHRAELDAQRARARGRARGRAAPLRRAGRRRARGAPARRDRRHRARRVAASARARRAGQPDRRRHRRRARLRARRIARREARGARAYRDHDGRRRQLHVRQPDAVPSRCPRGEPAGADDRLQQRPLAGRRLGDAGGLPGRAGRCRCADAARRARAVARVHEGRGGVGRVRAP